MYDGGGVVSVDSVPVPLPVVETFVAVAPVVAVVYQNLAVVLVGKIYTAVQIHLAIAVVDVEVVIKAFRMSLSFRCPYDHGFDCVLNC